MLWEAEGRGHEVAQDVAFKNLEECLTLGLRPQLAAGVMALEGIRATLHLLMREVQRGPGGASRSVGDLAAWPGAALCLPAWGGSLFCLQSGLNGSERRSPGHGRGLPGAAVRQCVVWVSGAHVGLAACGPAAGFLLTPQLPQHDWREALRGRAQTGHRVGLGLRACVRACV